MTNDPCDRIDGDLARTQATANVLARLTRAGVTGVTEEQVDILVRIEMMGLIAKQSAGQQQAEAIQ